MLLQRQFHLDMKTLGFVLRAFSFMGRGITIIIKNNLEIYKLIFRQPMCTPDKPVITRPQRAVGEQVQCLRPVENAAVVTKTVIYIK